MKILPLLTLCCFHMITVAQTTTSTLTMDEVVITGTQKETTKMNSPIPVEVYHPSYFKKNPTPGIFEALNIVNGVHPQLNCNVCNTGDIHINGMEGPYTMVLLDGMPIVSSLSTVYGLSGIPNSLVKRIEIVKGPASTLYGSEAVGGLINIITKDPLTAPRFNLDVSATSKNEFNADVSASFTTGKATSLIGISGFWFNTHHDVNEDNFTDFTLQQRLSLFNKWSFERRQGRTATIAFRYLYENRWGGQMNFIPALRGSGSIYGESIFTNRAELIGNYSLPVKNNNLQLDYSYNYHLQDSYYGIVKYLAGQHTAFTQLRWDRKTERHDIVAGIPFRYIYYDDNTVGTSRPSTIKPVNNPLKTYLPGIFIQDEITLSKKLTTLAGLRYDHHNDHGSIITPRLSFKYMADKNNTLRLSGGNGFRVVNLFTEDHAALTGSREVVIKEELKPEESWNVNLNYTGIISRNKGFISLDASLFYTYFTNKIVGDFMSDPDLIIFDNLKGHAISKGVTVNIDMNLRGRFKMISGITLMDVYQEEKNVSGKFVKTPQQFAPKFSATFALSYSLPLQFSVDLTGKVNGPMHLPVVPNDFRPDKSPLFALVNLQATKKFNNTFEIYIALKNLLNFIPANPILRPFDPFDKNIHVDNPHGYTFDPSYNYAPVQGLKGMAGFRYSLSKKRS